MLKTFCPLFLNTTLYGGVTTNLSEAHVLFNGVDASLEFSSGSVHVGDH